MNTEIRQLFPEREHIEADVARLYKMAGWLDEGETDFAPIARALKNSYCCFGAECDGTLAGFVRVLSDGVSDAYLLDLFVDPKFRKQGIGEKLCREIVGKLKADGIEWITCISTPEGESVYKKITSPMQDHTPFRF